MKYQSVIKMAEGSLKRSSAFLDNILLQGQSKFVMNLMLKRFFNEQIRSGKKITNTKDIVAKFAKYYTTSINIEIASKKSARAIQRWKDAKAQGTQFIAKYEKEPVLPDCILYQHPYCKADGSQTTQQGEIYQDICRCSPYNS